MMKNEVVTVNAQEGGINFQQYIQILRRRKWLIISFVVAFIVFGVIKIATSTPVYMASAKLQADPVQPNASAQDQFLMNSMIFLFYETQYEIIQSRKVAETVVEKLDLVRKYKLETSETGVLEQEEAGFISSIKTIFFTEAESESSATLGDEEIKTLLAQSIQANMTVEGGTQSQIININYQDEDPVFAAAVANAISSSYIQFGLEARLSQIKDTSEWLAEQLDELRVTLQNSEDKLRNFRLSQNLMDTEQQERITNTQLQTLNTELVRAQTELSSAKELFDQVSQIDPSTGDYRSIGPVLQSTTIRELVREESTLSRKVLELSERYGKKHPAMIAAESDWNSAKSNLNREVLKIVDNIRKDYKAAQVKENNIRTLIESTRNELQAYQGDSFELTRLEREVENNRRIYESFLSKLMESDVSGEYDASNIRVIDEATVPTYPIKPRPAFIIAIACFLGLVAGCGYAFIKEYMTTVFRTPDELEKELLLPSLGVTPLVKKKRKGIPPEHQYLNDTRSTFAEAINTIRTGLIFSNIDNPPKTILITSTTSAEGKTTLSVNLAVALSQMGRTLLLDLDLRKPAIAKSLGLKNDAGVTEAIFNGFNERNIQSIDAVPNLSILTSGSVPKNPMELIASRKFNEMIEKLKLEYDYIVLDSPPTLPVSDSRILSKISDATILAVKAEATKISSVRETLARLKKVNAEITGVVLTQASPEKMSYYGEHYYNNEYYGT
ncbi:GumC family protein [Alteromonas sp. RKMC-009]|uniref:GumC family protein n=1 Tax=Alteromonas sp. RKMC-009 TaxID=2267264 RepID=UPI000E6A5800|nr:polysaccharide biosynthesis tyrosine autokinase [Alteromonas sp. RKMC-009]AYA62822.1 polysaccharide biosynthesis tyrosine autokinase [Alteromonas sp. RKMC-009]